MSREGKLAKSTLILSVGTFLPKLATFIVLPILTGYLSKEEYGMLDLVLILVSLLLPAATLEIQVAAFRFLIDVRDKTDEIKTAITNIVVFMVPTSLVALIAFYLILWNQPVSIRVFICLYFLADVFINCAGQVCRGLDRNLDYSISAILSAVTQVVFVVICIYWLDAGLLGAVISHFAAAMIALLYLIVRVRLYRYIDLRYFNKSKLIEMLKYSWPMVPNSLSAWIIRASDRLVVTAFLGVSANAVYAVANKMPNILNIAQKTFTMAWQENASIAVKDADASQYYSSMFRTMFDLLAGFFCLLIALTPVLFKLLIHGDYQEAYYQIPILFLAMLFLGLSTYLGGIFIAYKRSRSIGATTVVAAVINLVIDISLIQVIGLYAASGSTLISYLFLFIYRLIAVQKIVRVDYSLKHLLIVLLLVLISGALCFLQNYYLNIINFVFGLIVFLVLNKPLVNAILMRTKRLFVKKTDV